MATSARRRLAVVQQHLSGSQLSQQPFKGAVVLVSGASRGIGRCIAVALAAKGARVAVHYNTSSSGATETVGLCAGGEGVHRVFQADLSRPDEAEQLVSSVVDWAGGAGSVAAVVNNAAAYSEVKILDPELSYEGWRENWTALLSTNLTSVSNVSFHIARRWAAAGAPGSIVNVSSRGAYRGEPDAMAYGASKAALNSMTQSMAKALGGRQIAVTAVAPGFVSTDMAAAALEGPAGDGIRSQSPMGRVATPEEVADAAVYLALPGSRFHTGAILDINGASYFR